MKHRFLLPLLSVLALLGVAAAAVFGMGHIAEQEWQAPDSSPAPVVNDTAIEQVESELKAYPYQILTLSAAQILYKEVAQAGAQLTMRETGGDSITAAKAAALAGELAMTVYGSDLSEKTLDLLPVFWQPYGTSDTLALWLAAYTLPDAAQTAPDSSTYNTTQGCWLFCLNAADGALLYSRCTALEGEADETALDTVQIDDESMGLLYRNTLKLAEALELSPASFWAGGNIHIERGLVLETYLALEDGRLCRMVFDEYFRTENLFEFTIASESFFDDAPPKIDRLPLPLQLPATEPADEPPSAVDLAAQGAGIAGKAQSASYSASNESFAYLSGYYTFSDRRFILCRIDPANATRSLLCDNSDCPHEKDGMIRCPAYTKFLTELTASETGVWPYYTPDVLGTVTGAVARGNTMYYLRTREGEDGYVLAKRDLETQIEEYTTRFDVSFKLCGWLGDYLVLCREYAPLTVIGSDGGPLQPHDCGWGRYLYVYDLNTDQLQLIHQEVPETEVLLDIKNGRLWTAIALDGSVQLHGRDLFTGAMLPDVSVCILPEVLSPWNLTCWELAGRYQLLRVTESKEARLYMADTVTGEVRTMPVSWDKGNRALIAVFGDEALIQQTTADKHRYYMLNLPALFEGRVERRWVTDDFVLG